MFKRIENSASEMVEIDLDGEKYSVPRGISVAAALYYLDALPSRWTPVSHSARAPYCMMGVCFDCLVEINGEANRQACLVMVADRMRLRRQSGAIDSEAD